MAYDVEKPDEQWRAELTPSEYAVLRQAGTEPAFVGEYTDTKTQGVYSCRACGAELFTSTEKFESHYEAAYYAGEAGDTATAIGELTALAADRRRVLGDDHHQTVATRRGSPGSRARRAAGGGRRRPGVPP
ncbi:Peptide methionine sulfoxide reductase MsrB [Streptomyces alboniger]